MDIEDIEIHIKKYDPKSNVVIANAVVSGVIEIRGFMARYTTTKGSPHNPVWVVGPPSVKGRNGKYFCVVRIRDSNLWLRLQKMIVDKAREYTNQI